MATVTGLTAERMLAIERASIVQGAVDLNGYLQLTNFGGDVFNAGLVRGPEGPKGDPGADGQPGSGASLEPIVLVHAQQLDTYTTSGFYIQPVSNSAVTGYGYPVNFTPGWLTVSSSSDGALVYQRYAPNLTNRFWTRSRVNGTWNAWTLFEPVLAPPAWNTLTLGTAHKSYSASYPCEYRYYQNRVYLRGLMAPTTGTYAAGSGFTGAFQLPLGLRPLMTEFYPGATTTSQDNATIVVDSSGSGQIRTGGTAASFVSLASVQFFYV